MTRTTTRPKRYLRSGTVATGTQQRVREQRFLPRKWQDWELQILLRHYALERSPTPEERRESACTLATLLCKRDASAVLATEVKNYERRVTNWFKNRRAKEKQGLELTQDTYSIVEECMYPGEEANKIDGADRTDPMSRGTSTAAYTPWADPCGYSYIAYPTPCGVGGCHYGECKWVGKYDEEYALKCSDCMFPEAYYACQCNDCKNQNEYVGESYHVGASGTLMSMTYSESFERGR